MNKIEQIQRDAKVATKNFIESSLKKHLDDDVTVEIGRIDYRDSIVMFKLKKAHNEETLVESRLFSFFDQLEQGYPDVVNNIKGLQFFKVQ